LPEVGEPAKLFRGIQLLSRIPLDGKEAATVPSLARQIGP
jgi:hypothetical protein